MSPSVHNIWVSTAVMTFPKLQMKWSKILISWRKDFCQFKKILRVEIKEKRAKAKAKKKASFFRMMFHLIYITKCCWRKINSLYSRGCLQAGWMHFSWRLQLAPSIKDTVLNLWSRSSLSENNEFSGWLGCSRLKTVGYIFITTLWSSTFIQYIFWFPISQSRST